MSWRSWEWALCGCRHGASMGLIYQGPSKGFSDPVGMWSGGAHIDGDDCEAKPSTIARLGSHHR